ncbi:hypothetical protein LTR28_013328, partial [Elasticomyces elasticus]
PSKSKPSFTTNQQHYSPVKSSLPKPPVPLFKPTPTSNPTSRNTDSASPSPSSSIETLRQQTTLLHLSLLHQTAESTLQTYTKSAKTALGARFSHLETLRTDLSTTSHALAARRNIHALATWCHHAPSSLGEPIQSLSSTLHDLLVLTAPGNRYDGLVAAFESWVAHADALHRQGTQGVSSTSTCTTAAAAAVGTRVPEHATALVLDPLSASWHAAHASLSQQVRRLARAVEALPTLSVEGGDGVSVLERVLGACCGLVRGVGEELEGMVEVEREVLGRERERVEEMFEVVVGEVERGLG